MANAHLQAARFLLDENDLLEFPGGHFRIIERDELFREMPGKCCADLDSL